MQKVPKGLRDAALMAAAIFGRFGAEKYGEPDNFDRVQVAGERSGAEIKGRRRSTLRSYLRLPKFIRVGDRVMEFKGHATANSENMYSLMPGSWHGRCTDWVRENRRRRACGMPQLRTA